MTAEAKAAGPLLTVPQVAERLNVSPRFVRRLIEERRITYVKLGRHVRIAEHTVNAYVAASLVQVRTANRVLRAVS